MTEASETVLRAVGVGRDYRGPGGVLRARTSLRAVHEVDLELSRGETLGIVGESGCGKSTLASLLIGQVRPTRGRVELLGQDLGALSGRRLRLARRQVQLVHQDPVAALDPRMSVARSISEPLEINPDIVPRQRRRARVLELLDLVGLDASLADRLPHRLSGGQRQRVLVARALALEPRVLVCDEPVSGLDVSVQAQVVNLLMRLQRELGLSIVLISHDLSVVAHMADRIAVMYLGRVVEQGQATDVEDQPAHPYTASLQAAVPDPDLRSRAGERVDVVVTSGEPPDPLTPPAGCGFHPRCRLAVPRCTHEPPALEVLHDRGGPGHAAACLFPLSAPSQDEPQL